MLRLSTDLILQVKTIKKLFSNYLTMSKCIYKPIAEKLNKEEVEEYYQAHLTTEVCSKFGFEKHQFYPIFDYLGIKRRTPAENTYLQYSKITDKQKQIIALKKSKASKGHAVSEETRRKISEAQKGVPRNNTSINTKNSQFKKGQIPWNKGIKNPNSISSKTKAKRIQTMKLNGTFNTSKPEEVIYERLCKRFGKDDIIRQYSEIRYPFNCDFYIKSLDKFIELNLHWTHGGKPYDSTDEECQKQLNEWKRRAETSKFYKNAIETWTIRDTKKIQTAKENNLNYTIIYEFK